MASEANTTLDFKRPPTREKYMQFEFPFKLHAILSDAENDETGMISKIVSWPPDGEGFQIHDWKLFEQFVLPVYFKKKIQYRSFQRQLNIYNFKRMSTPLYRMPHKHASGACSYQHPLFQKGKPELCLTMKRYKLKGNGKKNLKQGSTSSSTLLSYQNDASLENFSGSVGKNLKPEEFVNRFPLFNSGGMQQPVQEWSYFQQEAGRHDTMTASHEGFNVSLDALLEPVPLLVHPSALVPRRSNPGQLMQHAGLVNNKTPEQMLLEEDLELFSQI